MIFDDWKSIIHFMLGFVSCLASRVSLFLTIIIVAVFIMYQVAESGGIYELVGDVLEFLIGFFICCIILSLFKL
jgi:hydrogenase/urease accessory protein HupE